MSKKRVDIAIVGAGLVGATLALWLTKHTPLHVAVVEHNKAMSEPAKPNQRVVALGRLATDLLSDIGAFQQLNSEQRHPYEVMRVWDENSNGELEFDCDSLGQAPLGHMVDSLACSYRLQQMLIEVADSGVSKKSSKAIGSKEPPKTQCFFNAQLNNLVRDNGRGHLSGIDANGDALDISAQLIIAADGARSWVRQQAGIFANHHDYKQRGIVARISTEKLHQDCAWQRFLSTGPIAVLPLSSNQSSIVWSADDSLAQELLAIDPSEFETRLEHALQRRLGGVSLLSSRAGFPLQSQAAETYFKRNIVLVGDAAHSIHPLAGQGANLGFKDALALGELVAELCRNEATIKSLGEPKWLAKYQRQRQSDNTQTDALMSALHASFQFDTPIWMATRGLGMNVLNQSAVLRELLAKQAMGL